MRAHIRLPDTRLLAACLLLLSLFLIHQSCTKIDTSVHVGKGLTDAEVTQKFFALPAGTDPLVRRIAMQLQKQNAEKEFISAFAKNEGYAVWDKAQLKVKRSGISSFQGNSITGGDSIVIIPLVLENTALVNGYLQATISDSISILEYRRSGYTAYAFGSVDDQSFNAEKYQAGMMQLDNAVFGYTTFKITDRRLFAQKFHNPADTIKDRIITLSRPGAAPVANITIPSVPNCIEYCWYTGNINDPATWTDERDCWTVCIGPDDPPVYPSPGGGGGISPGGGSSGPGGGGGGTVPMQPPVWNPNPCQLIDSLMKLPSFKDSILTRLKDSVNTNHEVGYDWTNSPEEVPITPNHWGGAGGIVADVVWSGKRDGFGHSHDSAAVNLNIFSNEDIGKLYQFYRDKKMRKPTQFVLPLVTKATSYILVISDTAAFGNFGRTWLNTNYNVHAFGDYIGGRNSEFKVHEDSSVTANAVHFLQALKTLNSNACGMKLFMGAGLNRISRYIPVGEYNGTLVQEPCQ